MRQAMSREKVNLLDLNRDAMKAFFIEIGDKAFRAEQVMKWIYQFGYDDFDQMTNLNKKLREKLKQVAVIKAPEINVAQHSSDGTIKWAMSVDDYQNIEAVYIPEKDRATLCISTQIGCALACTFCSTAQQGFNRNLCVSEIVGQVWRAAKEIGLSNDTSRRPITNVVLMGMGEPLLNLNNVVPAIDLFLDDLGFGLSKRRVTISTAGVVPGLEQIAGKVDVALAISLHSADDKQRSQIMPINDKYDIAQFLQAVELYISKSKANRGKVTIEYLLLDHVNDSTDDAHRLAKLLKNTPCKINLIQFNPFPGSPYSKPSNSRVDRFSKVLMDYGFTVIVRKTRGDDIDAACGQLVGEVKDKTKRTKNVRGMEEEIATVTI